VPHIGVRDLDIHYEVAGEGAPVLLISGSGADLRHAPHHRHPLARHFEVIGYDQRGLGQTSKPDCAYSMADYADDAAGLLDALAIERAHVAGISFGGMVAQNLVLRHPDRVERLVLACTSPGGPDHASADLLALSRLPEAERGPAHLALFDTRCQPGAPIPDDLRPVLEARANRPLVTDPVALMGARRQLEARGGHDVCDRLAEIRSSTLVIGGVNDGIAPVRNLELMAERIPDSRLVLCDGGHIFFLQDRSAWPTVIDFLCA
jgi:3-oxoadipate enol-lactonase